MDRIGLLLGPLILVGWLVLVPQGDLPPEAHRLAGILLLTITWWLTEPIPIPITGLTAVGLCVLLQAVPGAGKPDYRPAHVALAPFADPSLFFLLGGLFLGRAMMRHGLDRRLALALLCSPVAARSPAALLTVLGTAVALISMWVNNTAATAMMFPVTLGIIGVLAQHSGGGDPRFSQLPYASGLLMITAYASSIGGIATPIGTATNVFAIGLMRRPEYLGQSIDFLRWSMVGIPIMVLILIGVSWWMCLRSPIRELDMAALRGHLLRQRESLGPWQRGEINTLVVFLLVVALWVMPGLLAVTAGQAISERFRQQCPEEIVALLIPILLYILPVNWRKREFSLDIGDLTKIDWGALLLFGAGLSLGSLMFKTKLADAVGSGLFNLLGTSDTWAITALAVVCGIVLSEFTGNVATASTLLPVLMAICRKAEVDPVAPLLGVTFASSFGSALPVSTPPNAIVYGSGLLPIRRMIVAGLGMDLICGVVIWIVLRLAFAAGWSPFVS